MFEVLDRDGMARVGSWKYGELKISTPALMFVDTDRIKAPEEADVILTTGEKDRSKSSVSIPEYRFLESNSGDKEISFIEPSLDSLDDLEPKELVVINNCMKLLRHPKDFVKFVTALRQKVGYQRPIFAPGIAAPWNISLLVYSGIDLFDSSRLVVESREGNFLTNHGKLKKGDGKLCFCKGCQTEDEYESLLFHNYYVAIGELGLVKRQIEERKLRELVELRAGADEWSVSVLRHM
ncbi:MAG: hypothetical protein KAI64_04165, partial [Thermoplasmata archaeon]|nr:hypothetical protein [Thermoplasmata archaeon]